MFVSEGSERVKTATLRFKLNYLRQSCQRSDSESRSLRTAGLGQPAGPRHSPAPSGVRRGTSGEYTFFLKYFLENEIFLDNLKFFVLIFSNFDKMHLIFFASELDSELLSTFREIIFKREASRVEGYVTPS